MSPAAAPAPQPQHQPARVKRQPLASSTPPAPGLQQWLRLQQRCPSHVLQAIGRSSTEAEASLRLSLGRDTTATDVDQAIAAITDAVAAAKACAP